jgi:5-methylcytosine-specific restriction endonuclease McrA
MHDRFGDAVRLLVPPDDGYPKALESTFQAIVERGVEAGQDALRPIAHPRSVIEPPPGLSRARQGEIYRRDRFQCRYCTATLIPASLMELLGELYPDEFPFQPNWKGGQTRPAILSRSPVIDHVDPGATGGDWRADTNLVTACWPCNSRKADFTLSQLGWALVEPRDPDWDGLTRFYPGVWIAAGRPKRRYHISWMRALGVTPPADSQL